MSKPVLAATLLLLVWPIGCGPSAEPPSRIEVIGTDNPAIDVGAVQEAVDGFEEVLLRGVFDFGEQGSVRIRRPVELRGSDGNDSQDDPDAHGPTTTIRGGFEPITIAYPTGGRVTIRDLTLHGATGTAILYLEGEDLLVQGVRIANVAPGHVLREVPREVLDREITGRFGINAWDWDAANERPGDRIRGRIRIIDCELDLAEPASPYSRAIVFGGGDANVTVSGTNIRDVNGRNTLGMEVFLGSQTITVERNRIEAGLLPIGVIGGRGQVNVRDNQLTLTGENAGSGVALIVATNADSAGEIAHNSFRLAGARAGIMTGWELRNPVLSDLIQIPYRNGRIADNEFSGTLAPGGDDRLHAGIALGYGSTENVLEGNELGGLALAGGESGGLSLGYDAANAVHIHLGPGSSGNVVRLATPDQTVEDEGTGDRVELP